MSVIHASVSFNELLAGDAHSFVTAQRLHDEAAGQRRELCGVAAFTQALELCVAQAVLRRTGDRYYLHAMDESSDEEEEDSDGAGAEASKAAAPVWAAKRCIWCLRNVDHVGEKCGSRVWPKTSVFKASLRRNLGGASSNVEPPAAEPLKARGRRQSSRTADCKVYAWCTSMYLAYTIYSLLPQSAAPQYIELYYLRVCQ